MGSVVGLRHNFSLTSFSDRSRPVPTYIVLCFIYVNHKTDKVFCEAKDFIIPVNLMGYEGNPVDPVNPVKYSYWWSWGEPSSEVYLKFFFN